MMSFMEIIKGMPTRTLKKQVLPPLSPTTFSSIPVETLPLTLNIQIVCEHLERKQHLWIFVYSSWQEHAHNLCLFAQVGLR